MNRFLAMSPLLTRTKCLGDLSKVLSRTLTSLSGQQGHRAPSSGAFGSNLLVTTTHRRLQYVNRAYLHAAPLEKLSTTALTSVRAGGSAPVLEVTTSEGRRLQYPTTWLRAHCQCELCFSKVSMQRTLLMEELMVDDTITSSVVSPCGGHLTLEWGSGHMGQFEAEWLLERAFEEEAKQNQREFLQMSKQLWCHGHELHKFDYQDLFTNDDTLLGALRSLEQRGAVLVQGANVGMEAGYKLAEHIGIAKKTSFGLMCNVYPKPEAGNLAYTEQSIDLHTDLVYYEEMPGVVFLHAVKKHTGIGGDSVISDAFQAAEVMRREYPDQFQILTESNAYFMDKGVDSNSETKEPRSYHKLALGSVINMYPDGTLSYIRFNNHLLDSFVDMPIARVDDFYRALKLFYELNLKNSISFKLEDGEMLIADNYRVLHGKKATFGATKRHLVACYCSWDEMRCKRRRLETKLC